MANYPDLNRDLSQHTDGTVFPTQDETSMVAELKASVHRLNKLARTLTEGGCKIEVDVLETQDIQQRWAVPVVTVSIMKEVAG